MDAVSALLQYKEVQIFRRLEEEGNNMELPWNKVSTIFNLARLFEESHQTLSSILLYRLILYKVCGIMVLHHTLGRLIVISVLKILDTYTPLCLIFIEHLQDFYVLGLELGLKLRRYICF